MPLRRFHVPRTLIQEGAVALPARQSHHLRDVLRLNPGEEVEIFDGEGSTYRGTIQFERSGVVVHGLHPLESDAKPAVALVLACALIKAARFEWVLQKGTELGVREFIPLNTRYSEIKIPGNRIEPRLNRWNRIIAEATRQCGASLVPKIQRPLDLSELLVSEEHASASRYIFYERASELWGRDIPQAGPILICVGPEGGWHADEIKAAAAAGFQVSGLGRRILRAETAALAAVVLMQHHLGLL